MNGLAGSVEAIEHGLPGGHPYMLAGNRLVFTNWFFVRPGQPDWQDQDGRSLYASKEKHDPGALKFRYHDRPFGIRLMAEPAQRTGPLMLRDRPWETMGISPNTLLQDEGKYRLWGMCRSDGGKWLSCYFESPDGRHWQRPSLGLVDFNGSRDNNLLAGRVSSVFKDPAAAAQERYKSIRHGSVSPSQFETYKQRQPWSVIATEMDSGKVHAILGAVSRDGLDWTELPDPLSIEPSDTQVIAYRDERLNKYVMYTRTYMIGVRVPNFEAPSPSMYQFLGRRAIGRTESESFGSFAPAQTILEPGPETSPTDQYYNNCRTSIPGAPDHHVFFPSVFHLDSDSTSVELYSSYDGRLLHRVPGPPVLETADYGQWDGGCLFSRPNLVELPDGSWALPYSGYSNPHKYPHGGETCDVGLAIWPKGRLVAIEASDEGGFTTPAFLPPGNRLRVNGVTKRVGFIQVEVANLSGEPLSDRSFQDAISITGDHFWTPVQWKTGEDLGIAKGDPIVLRFRLKAARLYGLEFE